MRWFLIKSYLVVATVTSVMFLFTIAVVVEPLLSDEDWSDFQQEITIDRQLFMLTLESVPEEEWPAKIASYKPAFDLEFNLLSFSELNAEQARILSGTGPASYLSGADTEDWFGLYSLPDSNQILEVIEDGSGNLSLSDWLVIIAPLVLISLAYAVSAVLILKSISKPVAELSDSALALGRGDLSARVKKPRTPVKELAESFNTMAEQLEEKIREQQIIIGAIPHELRTPLSRMRVALDLSRGKNTVEELKAQIEQIDGYSDELEQAVEDVLEFVRIKTGRAAIDQQFDLLPIVDELVEKVSSDQFTIHINKPESLVIKGNPSLIRRALENILTNAYRYAHSAAWVEARVEDKRTVIRIWDDGPGIQPGKEEQIFLAFSRLDESRGRNTGNLGLGLSFVQAIMKQHQGKAIAANEQEAGLCITLSWPQDSINLN